MSAGARTCDDCGRRRPIISAAGGHFPVRLLLQPLGVSTPTPVRALREGQGDLRAGDRWQLRRLRRLLQAACRHVRGLRADTTVPQGGGRHPDVSSLFPRDHRHLARTAAGTARQLPDGRRDRCAIAVIPPPFGDEGSASGVAASGAWSARRAGRHPSAATAQGWRPCTPVGCAAARTNCMSGAAANARAGPARHRADGRPGRQGPCRPRRRA